MFADEAGNAVPGGPQGVVDTRALARNGERNVLARFRQALPGVVRVLAERTGKLLAGPRDRRLQAVIDLAKPRDDILATAADPLADILHAGRDLVAHLLAARGNLLGNTAPGLLEPRVDVAAPFREAGFELSRSALKGVAQLLALVGEGPLDLLAGFRKRAGDVVGALQDAARQFRAGLLER